MRMFQPVAFNLRLTPGSQNMNHNAQLMNGHLVEISQK